MPTTTADRGASAVATVMRRRGTAPRAPADPPADEESDLLVRVGAGDDRALRWLYRRYERRIYWLGVRLLGDRGLAEELVQETFVRLWRSAPRYDPALGTARTYLLTIARRAAVDLRRRPSSRPLAPEPVHPGTEEDQVEEVILEVTVRDAMTGLSDAHREVLELAYRQDLRQTDIAEQLDVPLGTVKTRTHHALRALRAALEDRGIDA